MSHKSPKPSENNSKGTNQARRVDWFNEPPTSSNSVTRKIDWFDGTVNNINITTDPNEDVIDDWLSLNLEAQGGSYSKASLNVLQNTKVDVDPVGLDKKSSIIVGFGFIKLLEISKLEPNEVFMKFTVQHKHFKALLDEDFKPDKIVVLVKCIAKLCDVEFVKSRRTILNVISESNAIKSISSYIQTLPTVPFAEKRSNQYFWTDVESFWSNLFRFIEEMIKLEPKLALKVFPSFLETIQTVLEDLEIRHKEVVCPELQERFVQIQIGLTECVKMASPNELEGNSNNFRNIDPFPSMAEVTKPCKPFLQPNVINGAYQSVDEYLDIQFRLMREDFVSPLREAIIEFMKDGKKKNFDNIRIYPEAYINGYGTSKESVGLKIVFNSSLKYKKLNCISDEVFMHGSLLFLLEEDYRNGYFFTVESRDNILSGEIIGLPQNFYPDSRIFDKKYILIESKIYFPPYYFILKALQQPSLTSCFPMKEYFIDAKISDNPSDDLCLWNIENDFDESQLRAFKAALSNEFSIIQGPPGTGKTYIGLKIADTIISNAKLKKPLLILCYTNHALDQFLEKLLPITNKIIRVGGQSLNPILNNYNLKNIHRTSKLRQLKKTYYDVLKTISNICESLDLMKSKNHIVDVSKFSDLLNFPFDTFFEKFAIKNEHLIN